LTREVGRVFSTVESVMCSQERVAQVSSRSQRVVLSSFNIVQSLVKG